MRTSTATATKAHAAVNVVITAFTNSLRASLLFVAVFISKTNDECGMMNDE